MIGTGTRITGETNRKEIKVGRALSPWCTYEFRVMSANEYGFGPPSSPSGQYNTLPDRPYKAPDNVRGGGGKTNSLTISWDVSLIFQERLQTQKIKPDLSK